MAKRLESGLEVALAWVVGSTACEESEEACRDSQLGTHSEHGIRAFHIDAQLQEASTQHQLR